MKGTASTEAARPAVSFVIFSVMLFSLPRGSADQIQRRSPVLTDFGVAGHNRKILILLLMVASVTMASDPILVSGSTLTKHVFHASAGWSAYFIGAFGAGSVIGSLPPPTRRTVHMAGRPVLALLGVSMIAFALAPRVWLSVLAALTTQ